MVALIPNVPPDFMRAAHRSLLLNCGIDATHAFWRQIPALNDEQNPVALAERLARSDAIPLSWAVDVMREIERFLKAQRVEPDRFVDGMLLYGNGGSFVDSRLILTVFAPFLATLFQVADPYRFFFRMFSLAGDRFFPSLVFDEVLYERVSSTKRRVVVLFAFRAQWEGRIRPWNGDLFGSRFIQRMPKSLGLEPFDSVRAIADARQPSDVLDPRRIEFVGRELRVDGRSCGTLKPFRAFCESRDLQLRDHGQPDVDIVEMARSVEDPQDGQAVLQAGCAYGAPCYLLDARWRSQISGPHSVFRHFIEEAVAQRPAPLEARALALETEFLTVHGAIIRCVYLADSVSMIVQGRHVCTGVPARILQACLREHVNSGRTHFSFRELKRDSALVSHPKNTGFEVRLARLRYALDRAQVGVRIEPTKRGEFALRLQGRVRLEDGASAS